MTFTNAIKLSAAILLLGGAQVKAQETTCGPTEDVRAALKDQYGETRRMAMLTEGGTAVMEIYVNDETETWTLIVTGPKGKSCVGGSGVGVVIEAGGEPS